jgi:hypothetical protein
MMSQTRQVYETCLVWLRGGGPMNPDDVELKAVEPVPEQRVDPLLYRMVVGALALALLLTVLGGLILAGLGVEVPPAIIAVGAAAGGALGGLLAPSPGQG